MITRNYFFQGIDANGKKIHGKETACNLQQLHEKLKARGISVLKTKVLISLSLFDKLNRKIPQKTLLDFTRQLGMLCQANLDLVNALHIISQEMTHPVLRKLIFSIKNDIENGLNFGKALEKYPQYFDKIFCGLVNAGEQSGTLSEMLTQLADHQEQMVGLRAKITKALFYPSAIILAAILITSGLLIFVVPQFKNIFSSFGAELPLFTQWVIRISGAIQTQSGKSLVFLGMMALIYQWIMKKYEKSIQWRDQQLLRLPLIGQWLTAAIFARWTRTLATLLFAGIPLVDALETAGKMITNRCCQRDMAALIAQINTGAGFYQAFADNPRFPQRIAQMISVGESGGQLAEMLNQIARLEQAALDRAIETVSQWLEPTVMLILAVLIGGLIIAMYLPIFRLGAVM